MGSRRGGTSDSYLGARVGWRVVKAYRAEARRLGKHPAWLARRVLTLVAQEGLFEAVIDDERISSKEGK